ncbi:hypothetical protein [Thiorhodococcus minor]|uniref:Type II secretion system protein GspE N-terminal domain-containing protein n=1 Tax=Thiorhodococcus minor TaxID=57489 RepID=A0A6M0K7F4_9GAMM|nr:hypothetical protein [Thiorhodococcus minor]NEV64843.1 hypothetical protein [Thiorhodococcus minor]
MRIEATDSLDFPVFFGRFLVLSGLLTDDDIAEASALQKDLAATAFFILIERRLLSVEDMARALAYQREHLTRFPDALSALKILPPARIADAMRLAQSNRIRLGEILVLQGKITRKELEDALRRHRAHQGSLGLEKPMGIE